MTASGTTRKSRHASGRGRGKRAGGREAPEDSAGKPIAVAEAWISVGALVLLWLALFGPNLAGSVFVIGDAANFRPFAEFARERFAAIHDRTLWNPYVFLGIPSAASLADPRPQWAPDVVLAAWDALTADPVTALRMLLLGVLGGGLATAWLARVLWNVTPPAMVLAGGTLMAASGFMGPLAYGHDAQVWSMAITPVLLLATCGLFAVPPARLPGAMVLFAVALADAALRGVPVPGGSHRLDMAYSPPGWKTGRLLAGLGWLTWLALGVWALVGGRWRP